jgi:phage-related protein
MIINGACVDPAIYIGDHLYQVYCTVNEGEYLTIDSTSKTIILTANDGTQTNVFNSRNKDSYIFEKVKSGKNDVSWSGTFTFEIIILEERSEPKWT